METGLFLKRGLKKGLQQAFSNIGKKSHGFNLTTACGISFE